MKPLTAPELRGNWATLLLPIKDDDSIDFSLLGAEIDTFVAAGVNGIYSNGSAGEFYTQSEEEFDQVSVLLAEKCHRAGMPFQIGVCHTSPQTARARLQRVKSLRPSAVQLILPDWFIPSWSEIRAFLEVMMAEAAPIPVVLYNPPHAKRRLAPTEWLALASEFSGLVGIKVPGGDDAWYAAMTPVMQRVSVFIPGHQLADGLRRGAHGAYSNVACLSPRGAQRWYDLCQADPAAGLALGEKILAFWSGHVAPLITTHRLANMAADKAASVAGGWLTGLSPRLRWPYRSATSEQCVAIGLAARAEVPELFADRSDDQTSGPTSYRV